MPPRDTHDDFGVRLGNLFARKACLRQAIRRNYGLMHYAHGPRRHELYAEIRSTKAEIKQLHDAIVEMKWERAQTRERRRCETPAQRLYVGRWPCDARGHGHRSPP
jgi:hypothetical protein